jgi:aspartyl-tRNA(Asn)/glutamyl-tRNA(Gln) amidotransferase subunit B
VTALDFNRCGVPLIEVVTQPDLCSPDGARRFLVALKQVLEYLEVSDCNMEEGSLRVDANLSVRRPDAPLGVKQEVKNMNSFAAVERALAELRDLQIAALARGEAITLTTYTARTGQLRPMRTKEESHDYRYFPDPDLPPLVLSSAGIDVAAERAALPELPAARRARFGEEYGLPEYDAGVLTGSRALADYFEAVVAAGVDAKRAANWVMDAVLADAAQHDERFRVAPHRVAALLGLVADGTVSRLAAKRVFAAIAERDGEPRAAAERLGLIQVADAGRLVGWVEEVLAAHPDEAARYRAGETQLLGFLMGEVMKASRGQADPKRARELILARLAEAR